MHPWNPERDGWRQCPRCGEWQLRSGVTWYTQTPGDGSCTTAYPEQGAWETPADDTPHRWRRPRRGRRVCEVCGEEHRLMGEGWYVWSEGSGACGELMAPWIRGME